MSGNNYSEWAGDPMETEEPVRYSVPGKRYDFLVRRCFVYTGPKRQHRAKGFEVLRVAPRGHAFAGSSLGRFLDESQAHHVAKYLSTKDFVE